MLALFYCLSAYADSNSCFIKSLSLRGSIYGAYISACAALNAGVCIDNILAVALRDGGNGALALAGAAGDAFVVYCICHE